MSEKHATYRAPEAILGDEVYWFSGGNISEKPQPAKVVEVGRDALTLAIFQPMQERIIVKDSVRHVDDPRPRQDEVFYAGAWIRREDYFERSEVSDQMKASIGSHAAEKTLKEKTRKESEAASKKQPA
jgi:hypothetical protein